MTHEMENMLASTFIAISKLLDEFHIDINGFCNALKKYHIRNLNDTGYTLSRLALRSGIDRRTVSNLINENFRLYKPTTMQLIIDLMEKIASNNNMMIKKKGVDSIEEVMNTVASGATTLRSIIDELLLLGYIEDMGDRVKFLTNPFKMTPQKAQALETLSFVLDHDITQVIHANNCQSK